MKLLRIFFSLLALLLWSCANQDYDISEGIDSEVTLFSDEVSVPLGGIAPMTLKALLDKAGATEAVSMFVKEDEDGFLVMEEQESFYTNFVMLLYASIAGDPLSPSDVPLDDQSGYPGANMSALEEMGIKPSPQIFKILVDNPLTEEIAISGDVTFLTEEDSEVPADTIASGSFSKVKVPASTKEAVAFSIELSDKKALYNSNMENMVLHLPAAFMTKDPDNGMGAFKLQYYYKSYLSLCSDFPESLDINLDDVPLPLGKYRVSEACIRANVSSEVPITLEVASVQALVARTDEEGNTTLVPAENIETVTDLTLLAGAYGRAVTTPLELRIKATEGNIPDIAGLGLSLNIKAPTAEGDNRLNMNETISFSNIRAIISGGITFEGQ